MPQDYQSFITNFRTFHVPPRYNQLKLLDELPNKDIDHYISISNRTDGKSFNYVHALLNIAIEYDLGLCLISRNMMLRVSYQTLIDEIIDQSEILDRKDFNFIRTQYYVQLNYKDRRLAVVAALNDATELKQFSNFLKKFPILIYDEFLALESDYLSDEFERMKTIYDSIDRQKEYPLIGKPKVFYLGNAVNFDSPILSSLKLFNILENHPMNTAKQYNHVMLEMHKNENANQERNIRAFGGPDDNMTTGKFKTNPHRLATPGDREQVKRNPRTIWVKLKQDYLKIWFNRDTFNIILSIESTADQYDYNLQLKDNTPESVYLSPKYFDENHIKRHDKGHYLYDNNYSKNMITNDFYDLNQLKLNKLIREQVAQETPETERNAKEQQFEENYIKQSIQGIYNRFWE